MRMCYAFVHRIVNTFIGLGNPIINVFCIFFDDFYTFISRTSIDDDVLIIGECLIDDAIDGLFKACCIVVIDSDYRKFHEAYFLCSVWINSVELLSIFLILSSILYTRLGNFMTLRNTDCLRIYGGTANMVLKQTTKNKINHFVPHALINTFIHIAMMSVNTISIERGISACCIVLSIKLMFLFLMALSVKGNILSRHWICTVIQRKRCRWKLLALLTFSSYTGIASS